MMPPGKTIVGLSALLSVGFVVGLDLIDRRAEAHTGSVKIEERHPDLSGAASTIAESATGPVDTTMATKRADRLTQAGECATQAWPYLTEDCLAQGEGAAVRTPVRTITIERRPSENMSVLLRVPRQEERN